MDTKLVIHCVGLEGLTITVSGADHSILIITDVLRVTTLLGIVEYTIPQLPVTYNTADLNGNLTISDNSGKALYRWRSHVTAQPPPAEPRQPGSQPTCNRERERHLPIISAPPSYRTAETPPNLRSSRALNELNDHQDAPSDAEAKGEDLNGPRRLRSGNARKVNHVEPSMSRSTTYSPADQSTSSSPGRSSKRKSDQRPKGNIHTSENRDSEPSGSDIPLAKKRRLNSRPKVARYYNDSDYNDSNSDATESDSAPPRKQRSRRMETIRVEKLSDRESGTPFLDMTRARTVFLRHLVDRLLRENGEDSEPFAQPVNAIAENVPTYHTVIKRPMDLRTLKENLGNWFYSAVEDFEADFRLMIENSIRFNGLTNEVSQGGLRLLNAFNALMASLPGRN